jgi:hypothetical protein
MPRGSITVDVKAPCEVVFDVLHDYGERLRWDTMLSEARLVGDASRADVGVRSLCVGTWRTAYLPIETEYITFRRGEVAAVRLTNESPLFENFAASIRHLALPGGASRITYTYSFRTRARLVAAVVDAVVSRMMAHETRTRLLALRDYIERGGQAP